MTPATARTHALAALDALARAGKTPALNPSRPDTLQHAMTSAQKAIDALGGSEPDLQSRWAAERAHWEKDLARGP